MITKRDSPDLENEDNTPKFNLKKIKTSNEKLVSDFKQYKEDTFNFNHPEKMFVSSEANPLIPFFALTDTMNKLENSSGSGIKNKKKKLILGLFNLILNYEPESLGKFLMVLHCRVFPEYKDKDYGIGNSFIYQLISTVSKKKVATLKKEMKKVGDLGTLVAKYFPKQGPTMSSSFSKMTFKYWFEQMQALSEISNFFF
jgi:hypothetical protein